MSSDDSSQNCNEIALLSNEQQNVSLNHQNLPVTIIFGCGGELPPPEKNYFCVINDDKDEDKLDTFPLVAYKFLLENSQIVEIQSPEALGNNSKENEQWISFVDKCIQQKSQVQTVIIFGVNCFSRILNFHDKVLMELKKVQNFLLFTDERHQLSLASTKCRWWNNCLDKKITVVYH